MTLIAEIDDRIEKCNRILDQDPNSQIFASLAEAYRKKGDLDKAFRICQNGLRVHPSYASAHVVMSKINLDRGQYDWAEAEIKKAIDIEGPNRGVELLLAEIRIYRGDFQSAITTLKRLIEADPTNDQIRKLLDIAQRLPAEQAQAMQASRNFQPRRASDGKSKSETTEVEETIVQSREPERLTAKQIARQSTLVPDVNGALFVTEDGLIVENEWSGKLDSVVCAATMAELDRFLSQELVRAAFGRCQALLVESTGPIFYLVHVNDGFFLFVCDGRINLGTLRMKISSLVSRYQGMPMAEGISL